MLTRQMSAFAGVSMAAVGLGAMRAAAANTPIAAAVMAMELLPGPEGVFILRSGHGARHTAWNKVTPSRDCLCVELPYD
jgi:hypothetical protein